MLVRVGEIEPHEASFQDADKAAWMTGHDVPGCYEPTRQVEEGLLVGNP